MPKTQVTQDQLQYATALLNQMDHLQETLDRVAGVIFQKLDNGCELENGSLSAEIRTQRTATTSTKSLFFNGREA